MNRVILIVLAACGLLCTPLLRGGIDDFHDGVDAYVAGDYSLAREKFAAAAATYLSPATLHNLGNSEWKNARVGPAILAWERARSLDPWNKNTAGNLRFARRQAQLEEPDWRWHEVYSFVLSPNLWIAIATGSFWLWIGVFSLPRLLRWNRTPFQQALAATGLTLFLLTLPALVGLWSRSHVGIVTGDGAKLGLTPTSTPEVIGQLAPGELARIERQRGDYLYVRAIPDRAGWLPRAQFESIWSSQLH